MKLYFICIQKTEIQKLKKLNLFYLPEVRSMNLVGENKCEITV